MKKITTIIKSATIPEWLSESTINAHKLPSFYEAVNTLHNPKCAKHVAIESASMRRLIYDELLASQISLQLARNKRSNIDGMTISSNGNLIAILKKSLPFVITHAQHSVIEDIIQDQARHRPMFRLLQGDVGSGKTLVALIAMLNTIDAGKKAALMAPTTILASQHYHWITSITSNMNVNVAILTSSSTTKERREILHKIQNKKIDILIGTHAITNEDIQLKNFGLIVIDEQHRFGVKQRAMLFMQSSNADILMMTATPIPRTLAMSIYGDIDISIISDKPSNRKAVDTRMISSNKMDSLLQAIERALNGNEKIFWICATIEESDHIDLTAATNRYKDLNSRFGEIVGLLHGRMTEADSISVMKKFLQSEIRLLVSTTVIEIGVDIPDATIIVIEQAERFGLAQLHQLRGRVGRSDKQSYCFLLYSNNISISAKQRIKVIRDSNDGFYIAEKDMRIRGGGSILGVQQSGFGEFKFANLSRDSDLLYLAQKEAYKALQNDAHLLSERGAALRLLLRIF